MPRHPEQQFKDNINLGWTKLDEYYALTDRPPAYIAATVVTAPSLMRFGSLGYTIFLAPWPILRYLP
jgi:hypothetical protein